MRLSARGVSKGQTLPEATVHARSGSVTVVPVEGSRRPGVLGLILSGRMTPDTGEVTIDGEPDSRAVRRTVALVDAPDISAPADDLALPVVLREELVFAGIRGTRAAVRRMLADEGLAAYRATSMGDLPADVRVRVLTETATRRRGVEAVVIVSPDRHGGDPRGWYDVARGWADRGLAVVVLAGGAAVEALGALAPGGIDGHGQVHEEIRPPGLAADDATAPLPAAPPVSVVHVETRRETRRADASRHRRTERPQQAEPHEPQAASVDDVEETER